MLISNRRALRVPQGTPRKRRSVQRNGERRFIRIHQRDGEKEGKKGKKGKKTCPRTVPRVATVQPPPPIGSFSQRGALKRAYRSNRRRGGGVGIDLAVDRAPISAPAVPGNRCAKRTKKGAAALIKIRASRVPRKNSPDSPSCKITERSRAAARLTTGCLITVIASHSSRLRQKRIPSRHRAICYCCRAIASNDGAAPLCSALLLEESRRAEGRKKRRDYRQNG